jgi:hypothetical protein
MHRLRGAALRAARVAALPQAPHVASSLTWCRSAGGAPLVRDARFNTVNDDDLAFFRGQLGATAVITGASWQRVDTQRCDADTSLHLGLLLHRHARGRCVRARGVQR